MAEETELERLRRLEQEAACVTEQPALPQLSLPVPDVAPCDPAVPPLPDVFLPPNPAVDPPAPELNLPGPVVISSPSVTVDCAEGEGTVTHPLGYLTDSLYISDLEAIPRSEIYRTASAAMVEALQSVLDTSLEDLAAGETSPGTFDGYVSAATGLDDYAAAAIREAALQIRADLLVVATTLAESELRCLFRSAPLWVICADDDDGYAVVFTDPGDVTKVFRPASFETSYISVQDANDRAVFDAVRDLDCVYLNEPQTVTCPDLDPKFAHAYTPAFEWNGDSYATLEALAAAGFSALTADDINAGEASTELVYSFTQGPSAAFAASTQAAANERAYAAALASLRCFFPSRQGVLDCVNVDPSGEVADRATYLDTVTADGRAAVFNEMTNGDRAVSSPPPPENLGVLSGPLLDDSLALIVNKPAGLFISYDTPEDAEELADTYAATFLRCVWLSPPISCACTDNQAGGSYDTYLYTAAQLAALKVHVNLDRSSPPATLPFGYTESDTLPITNPADPESPLWPGLGSLCLASIACSFCNDLIPPKCTIAFPGGVEPGDDLYDPVADLPLELPEPAEPALIVSEDITGGLAADSVCDSNPNVVASFSGSLADLPPIRLSAGGPNDGCKFVNAAVTVTCADKVGGNAFALHSTSAGRSITIPAGQFDSFDSPAAANAAALAFAYAVLICEFTNPELAILCGAVLPGSVDADDYAPGGMTVGSGAIGGDQVHETSVGATENPIVVARNFYRSQESPYDAFIQAWIFGAGQLDCFFIESETAYCLARPDTRIMHVDRWRVNGSPWIPYDGLDSGWGSPWPGSAPDSYGQTARFKHAGPVPLIGPNNNPPGQAIPSASDSAKSYVSAADASQQALSAAQGRLDCTHTNWRRYNNGCGSPNKFAVREGYSPQDSFEAASTEEANLMAELAAIAATECAEFSPFGLAAFGRDGEARLAIIPGGISFWSSELICAEGKLPGEVDKTLYWEDCGGGQLHANDIPNDIDDNSRPLGEGDWLVWVEAQCCDDELRYIVKVEADDGSDGDITRYNFYPTNQYKARAEGNDKFFMFIGAIRVEAPLLRPGGAPEIPDEPPAILVNQHVRSRLDLIDISQPPPFTLKAGPENKVKIWPGKLVTQVSTVSMDKVVIAGKDAVKFEEQPEILQSEIHIPAAVAGAKFYVQLDWTGDVYLEWYCSDTGEVTGVDITGPDQPTQKNIPRLNAEFNRAGEDCPPEETECSECGGLFYVKIGNINEDGIVTQNIDGNFFWSPTIFQGSCDASSESSSESSPESSSSPESPSSPESSVESSQEQSSKSTAIVPVSFYETGYAAVYTMEAPDIRFEDVFQDLRVRGRRTEFTIDPRFLEVCEPGTLRVVGVAGDLPHVVGAVITDCGKLALTASMVPILRPRVVNVKISGIRKGFLGIRFGKRTRRQFVENEATLNASYSGYADSDRH